MIPDVLVVVTGAEMAVLVIGIDVLEAVCQAD